MTLLLLSLGLVLLFLGAELLVRGASYLAKIFGISPLVIGLTVVAFGTSLPELAVGIKAAFSDHPDLLIGNCIGSNIFNVLFILGVCAIFAPLVVQHQLIWLDVPIMIGAHVLLLILGLDGSIGRWDGALLLACLAGYNLFNIRKSRKEAVADSLKDFPATQLKRRWFSIFVQVAMIAMGLSFCVFGADLLIDSASAIARSLGVSELLIGLTLVAFGTSIPEVATSFVATMRGQRDLAIGNVVGSSIFNILGIIGLVALISPQGISVAPSVITFDLPIALAASIACLPIFFTGHRISRWEGALFLAYYGAYVIYLWLSAQHHDSLPLFSDAMLWFVIPLTVVTMGILAYRAARARS